MHSDAANCLLNLLSGAPETPRNYHLRNYSKGFSLPATDGRDYMTEYERTKHRRSTMTAHETQAEYERQIQAENEAEAELGDVIVLKIASYPVHMGVMIDERLFIHAERGLDVSVGDTKNYRWRNRIDGYYRHK